MNPEPAAQPFVHLLRPFFLASRNRARRWERADLTRGVLFGGVALAVAAALFYGFFWLTTQLLDYEELGDFLPRIGLSWLFLTFLSFLAFSGVVTALSTFFLSDDLRLLLAAPVAVRRVFHARFLRTVAQASWMVVIFLAPVLMGIGWARCAGPAYYVMAMLTVAPFAVIPVAAGSAVSLLLGETFPGRRGPGSPVLIGPLFAGALLILLRLIPPEQLMRRVSLPGL